MTAGAVVPAFLPAAAGDLSRRALAVLRVGFRRGLRFRLRCLILGHDDSFSRRPGRLTLRCTACGRETRGWSIGPAAAAATATAHSSPAVPRPVTTGSSIRRAGPWPNRWTARRDARDRQRLRLAAAASRAAEVPAVGPRPVAPGGSSGSGPATSWREW